MTRSARARSSSPAGRALALAVLLALGLPGCVGPGAEREAEVARARERSGPVPGAGGEIDAVLRAPPADPRLDEGLASAPTLALVEDAALRRNPGLASALERWVAFLERPAQRSALPAPMATTQYQSMFRMLEAGGSLSVPWPSKLLDDARAALAEADAVGADYRAAENALRAQAATAYATLALARRQVAVVDESLALLARFVTVVQARYRAGTASLPDVLRVETERESLLAEREVLSRNVDIAASGLNVLLDRAPDAGIGPLAPLEEPRPPGALEALYARALARRPELAAARARADATDLARERATDEWLPDFQLGAAYVRDLGSDHNFADFTAGLSLPWFFAPAIAARVRESRALHRGAEADARAMRNSVLDEVRSSHARVEAGLARLRRLTAEVIPRVRRNVEASEAAYAAGQVDFLSLVDTQRTLLQALLEREATLADLTIRQAELGRAIGGAGEDAR